MNKINRRCSYCKFTISDEDVEMKNSTMTYHKGCRASADEFTSSVPGQLSEIIRRTKRHCAKDGTPYELGTDVEAMRFLLDLFESQNGTCPLTGLAMDCSTDHEYGFLLKPSLDRLDNSRGYTRDNVRFTLQWSNLRRSFLSDEQNYRLCKAVVGTYEAKNKRREKASRQNRNKGNTR